MFLGLQIDGSIPGTVTLTQTGLIEKILAPMDISECNHKYAPADKGSLGKDEDGEHCRES